MAEFTVNLHDEYFAILTQLANISGVSVNAYASGLITTNLQRPSKVKLTTKALKASQQTYGADIVLEALSKWMEKPANHDRPVDVQELFLELESEIAGKPWIKSTRALAQRLNAHSVRRKFRITEEQNDRSDRKVYRFHVRAAAEPIPPAPRSSAEPISPPGGRVAPRLAVVGKRSEERRRPLEETLPPAVVVSQAPAPEKPAAPAAPAAIVDIDRVTCCGCGSFVPKKFAVDSFGGTYHRACAPIVDTGPLQ